MKKRPFLKFIFLFFAGFSSLYFITACVSVNLAPKGSVKAKNFNYQEPTTPFEKKELTGADLSWQSTTTGNSISVVTDCSSAADVNLESIQNDFYQSLSQPKIHRSESKIWNEREALFSEGEGKLDGVPVRMEFVVLSKNACLYTLSFVGATKKFASEKKYFEQFINAFKVGSSNYHD
jgi:hypothetical protein